MKGKLDVFTVVVSIVAGCVWWLLGGILYRRLLPELWSPLRIALYFAGLAVLLVLACLLAAVFRGYTLPESSAYWKAAVAVAAVFVAAGLFQYLYSLDYSKKPDTITSYIFLLDDSGSMKENDPKMERAEAVKKVMKKEQGDFPFAVYSFSSGCSQAVPVTRADRADSIQIKLSSYGGTAMTSAIKTILRDIESGRLEAGDCPRIILLSDGANSEHSINGALRKAAGRNVSISTVAFGDADERSLRHIAESTGGVYVSSDNLDGLAKAMQTAAVEKSSMERTLIGLRPPVNTEWLFGVARCLFLILIGAGFLVIKSLLMRTNDTESSTLVENAAAILIGALAMELLTNGIGLNETIVQLLLCVGFCLLLTTRIEPDYGSGSGSSHSVGREEEDEYYSTGRIG